METKHKEFKPFDKVLVKVLTDKKWTPDLYSYYDDSKNIHWSIGSGWVSDGNLLPYEGNEYLVGTTDEPEEEIPVKYFEWIMASNICSNDPSTWRLEQCANIKGEDKLETRNENCYYYFIRFSDFNPNDMEETKKQILCVKNGKIIRYKG